MIDLLLTTAQKERLIKALASGSRLGATDMRLINIDVYRKRLGDQWHKYKNIIRSYALKVIKLELAEPDFAVETTDGYAIFFFEKDVSQTRAISERIAAKIDNSLAGDANFGDPPLTCQANSVNCETLLEQLQSEPPPPDQSQVLAERLAVLAVLEGSPSAQEKKQPSGVYAPFWHTKTERIVGSICVPRMPAAIRRLPEQHYYAPNRERAQDDIHHFNAMLSTAYKLHKAGHDTAIVFSLNFKTFCAPDSAKEYMQVLRQAPASLVKYLTPRFVRIPPGTPQTLLTSRVQMLTTIFRHVILQTPVPISFRSFEFVPCSIVATSWKDVAHIVNQDTRSAETVVRTFCQSARALRMNSMVDGVDSPAAFEIALGAGAEFISGAAVCPPEAVPLAQRQATLADIRAAHRRPFQADQGQKEGR